MKLGNLRLGPVEPGGTLSPLAPTAAERQRKREGPPVAQPAGRREPRPKADPVGSGFSVRRSPGRAVAAVVSGAVLLTVAGVVLISTILADRTMMQGSVSPPVASPGAASRPAGNTASRAWSGTGLDVPPPEPRLWMQPQQRAGVPGLTQQATMVPAISPTVAALPSPPASEPALDPEPAQAAAPTPPPVTMTQASPEASPAPLNFSDANRSRRRILRPLRCHRCAAVLPPRLRWRQRRRSHRHGRHLRSDHL